MKYKSFVCVRCKGLMLGDIPRSIIAGDVYHLRCGARVVEEKLLADIKELSKEKE